MPRLIALLVVCFAMGASAAHTASATSFPDHAIRLIIPYPPAGAGDIVGRIVSAKLADGLKQPIVVDNRGGGGQVIATQITAKAPPDGYTLLLASATHAINPGLLKKLPYDTNRDFAAITLVADSPLVFVAHPSLGVGTIQELIKAAKAKPGGINYASSGPGTGGHLSVEMLKSMAGIDLVHIPYQGAGPALVDVVGGRVQVMCTSPLAALPHVKSGRLKILAVTGAARSNAAPGVPTVAEQGVPGFQSTLWYALVAPAATPRPVIDRLYAESAKILKLPDVVERLSSQGAQPLGLNPQDTEKFIAAEISRWTKLIVKAGIKAE